MAVSCFSMNSISKEMEDGANKIPPNSKCRTLSDEYKLARKQAFRDIRSNYEECRKSLSAGIYWKARAECVNEYVTEGGTVSTRCQHVSGGKKGDVAICDIFEPSGKDSFEYFQKIVNERNIKKCAE